MTFTETVTPQKPLELELEGQELVRWAHHKFGSRLKLACSFGAEDIVLIDMITQTTDAPRIFTKRPTEPSNVAVSFLGSNSRSTRPTPRLCNSS